MKLKEYRKKNHLTQKDVSERIGIPQTTLFSYESEVCDPSVSTLIKLSELYHITIDELVGRPTNLLNLALLEEKQKTIIQKILTMNDEKLEIIEIIEQLNDINASKVIGYAMGLLAQQ